MREDYNSALMIKVSLHLVMSQMGNQAGWTEVVLGFSMAGLESQVGGIRGKWKTVGWAEDSDQIKKRRNGASNTRDVVRVQVTSYRSWRPR